MITLNMMIIPQGIGMLRDDCLTGSIWTSDCGRFHCYNITVNDKGYYGQIDKTQSGHRNPIDLLHNITKDIINADM